MLNRAKLRPGESETKALIAILILMLAAGPNAAAKCACSLGASYNFLGDPSMDVNMEGYEEFARENVQTSSIAALGITVIPDVKMAAQSRLNLNLKDKSIIYLVLSKTQEGFSGDGSITVANGTETVKATGTLEGNKLSLDVTASGGELYKFNLASEGSTVMGDFSEALPNGVTSTGLATGKWKVEA
jgi:hypothetical protein